MRKCNSEAVVILSSHQENNTSQPNKKKTKCLHCKNLIGSRNLLKSCFC